MGAPSGEFGSASYADAEVEVTLTRPYEIQQTEVTQKAWLATGFPNPTSSTASHTNCLEPDCPIATLTWSEAAAYANYLSRTASPPLPECYGLESCTGTAGTGMHCEVQKVLADNIYRCAGYRLPTEAEWEYAARGGTKTAFYSGPITTYPERTVCNSDANLEKIGWFCNNSGKTTHPVGQKAPNSWGMFDASGNVNEWVNDHFDGLGYGKGPLIDPVGSNLNLESRVIRGGHATDAAIFCKSSYRWELPSSQRAKATGMRLARTLTK